MKFGTGLALLSVGIVMTSTLQHRNDKQGPSSDGAAQHSKGIGRTSSAKALERGVKHRQSLAWHRQKHSIESQGRSKALGINALAKRWNETFCDGKPKPSNAQAKQGVTRHWHGKEGQGIGKAVRCAGRASCRTA